MVEVRGRVYRTGCGGHIATGATRAGIAGRRGLRTTGDRSDTCGSRCRTTRIGYAYFRRTTHAFATHRTARAASLATTDAYMAATFTATAHRRTTTHRRRTAANSRRIAARARARTYRTTTGTATGRGASRAAVAARRRAARAAERAAARRGAATTAATHRTVAAARRTAAAHRTAVAAATAAAAAATLCQCRRSAECQGYHCKCDYFRSFHIFTPFFYLLFFYSAFTNAFSHFHIHPFSRSFSDAKVQPFPEGNSETVPYFSLLINNTSFSVYYATLLLITVAMASLMDSTPSLRNSFLRWYFIVSTVRKSREAISSVV